MQEEQFLQILLEMGTPLVSPSTPAERLDFDAYLNYAEALNYSSPELAELIMAAASGYIQSRSER